MKRTTRLPKEGGQAHEVKAHPVRVVAADRSVIGCCSGRAVPPLLGGVTHRGEQVVYRPGGGFWRLT